MASWDAPITASACLSICTSDVLIRTRAWRNLQSRHDEETCQLGLHLFMEKSMAYRCMVVLATDLMNGWYV